MQYRVLSCDKQEEDAAMISWSDNHPPGHKDKTR